MEDLSGRALPVQNTRRWPRQQVDLPVQIIALNGVRTTPIPARASSISRAGMSLHAQVAMNPGDRMQLQFPTSTPTQVKAVVRNRTADALGLEFLTQLPPDSEAIIRSRFFPSAVVGGTTLRKSAGHSFSPQILYAGLRRKQKELSQLKREIDALNRAIPLLTDDDEDLFRL